MNDNGNGQPAGVKARLLIGVFEAEDGTVFVNGPVDDFVRAMGLLEMAKQIVVDHQKATNKQRRILAAPPGLRIPTT